MRDSFNISIHGPARFFLLCCLGAGGLAEFPAPARPIEFSEPGVSNLTVNVSGLGGKPAELPDVGERVFRPHNYDATQGIVSGIKLQAGSPAAVFRANNRAPGLFDRDKNWLLQTPQDMLQNMMEKDAVKLPVYEAVNKPLNTASVWDPYSLQSSRRNSATKSEARSGVTNRLDGGAVRQANDPFAAFSGHRSSPDVLTALDINASRPHGVADWLHTGNDSLAENRRDQMDIANQLEIFKKNQGYQMPADTAGWVNPAAPPRRDNAFVSDVEKSLRPPGGVAVNLFAPPTAPVAPSAPLAPGQTSLTPAPYAPPVKPKPLDFSAPRRVF